MEITIVGEAASKLQRFSPKIAQDIPAIPWKQVIGIRNIVVHDYFRTDVKTIWDTIQHDLDPLYKEIELYLSQKQEISTNEAEKAKRTLLQKIEDESGG